MSHIDALNAYERSAVYQPFSSLCLASRVLHFSRKEHDAEDALNDIARHGGASLYPDHYSATRNEWDRAHTARIRLISGYVKDRGMRAGVRRAA